MTTRQDAASAATYGVHSEVGRLRKVLVCAPGAAHRRLTPTNSDALLFDDVMWVESAQRDHLDFVTKLRDRGVDVVELHDLLAQTMDLPEAKSWLLDRKIVPNQVGVGLVDDTRGLPGLDGQPRAERAPHRRAGDLRPAGRAPGAVRRARAGVDRQLGLPHAAPARTPSTPATPPAGSTAGSR